MGRSGTALPDSWRQELTSCIATMKWSEFQRMGEDDHEAKQLAEQRVHGHAVEFKKMSDGRSVRGK